MRDPRAYLIVVTRADLCFTRCALHLKLQMGISTETWAIPKTTLSYLMLGPAHWSYSTDDNETVQSSMSTVLGEFGAPRVPDRLDSSPERKHEDTAPSSESSLIFTWPPSPHRTSTPPPTKLPAPGIPFSSFTPPITHRTSTMASEVGTFKGDGLASDQDPHVFFNKCRVVFLEAEPQWSITKQMEWLALKTVQGSEARKFVKGLASKGITDTAALKSAWESKYIVKPVQVITVAVSRTKLEDGVAEEAKIANLTALLNGLQMQVLTRTTSQGAPGLPQPGFGAFAPRHPRFSIHTPEDQVLRTRPIHLRLSNYLRTKLPRATTQEEYQHQITKYQQTHPGLLPTEQHPYPLSPGTADAALGKCYECGYKHRRDENHGGTKLKFEETSYRRMAGTVTNANTGRPPAAHAAPTAPATQINLVDLVAIVQQQLAE